MFTSSAASSITRPRITSCPTRLLGISQTTTAPKSTLPMTCRPGVVRITSERKVVEGLGYIRADATPRRTKRAIIQAKRGNGSGSQNITLAEIPHTTREPISRASSTTSSTGSSSTSGSSDSNGSVTSASSINASLGADLPGLHEARSCSTAFTSPRPPPAAREDPFATPKVSKGALASYFRRFFGNLERVAYM
ncbi:hypothetical protein FRC12_003792 [Ceratobasidium sp. 428]|nr:hypothetical protein FRC12_003792 [Ceratobasidium sp. 428]